MLKTHLDVNPPPPLEDQHEETGEEDKEEEERGKANYDELKQRQSQDVVEVTVSWERRGDIILC